MLVTVVSLQSLPIGSEPADGVLIDRTLDGDEAAFAVIVGRYQRKIFRVALAIVRDQAEAETVTQDTFVQAYMSLRSFERRACLETWLTRIAINKARDFLRGRKWVSLSGNGDEDSDDAPIDPVDEAPDPERVLLSKQLRRAIERAVETLSAQQKVIFRLRHFEELPLEQIGEMLGLNAGTVRAHLFRAVHKVRKQLASLTRMPQEVADEAL